MAAIPTWYTDFHPELSRTDIPVLVMHGEQHRIVPITVAGAKTAKLFRGAKYVIVKDGPHNIAWMHADIVNPVLVEFLK